MEGIKESKRKQKKQNKKELKRAKYPFRMNERRTSTREMLKTANGKKHAVDDNA